MHKLAYWLGPEGEHRELRHQSHVGDVIGNPGVFGVTAEWLREAYDRHHEPLGLEGLAREVILRVLIRQGWIRIRWQPEVWQVTCCELDPPTGTRLARWAAEVLRSAVDDDPHRPLRVTTIGEATPEADASLPGGSAPVGAGVAAGAGRDRTVDVGPIGKLSGIETTGGD